MSLSRLHKARYRIAEFTGLSQPNIPSFSLETICPTQKVLADEASPRDPPKSSEPPNPQISETFYPIGHDTDRRVEKALEQ